LAKLRAGIAIPFNIADFGTKRLVRIVPPFYIAVAIVLVPPIVIHLLTHHTLPPAGWVADWRSVIAQLFFLDGRVNLINGSFWTLMVELRWYFAFPVLLWIWIRSPRAFVAVGVASIVLFHLTRARGLDFGTLPGFMLGIVAADLFVNASSAAGWRRELNRWSWILIAPAVALGAATQGTASIPGVDFNDVAYPYQPTILGWQIACFAFVVFAGSNAFVQRLLSLRVLVATGVASYGIYLVHEPIINVLSERFTNLQGVTVAGVIALAAGFAFWAIFERPFTTGTLRAPLLAWVRPRFESALAFIGVGRVLVVGPSLVPQQDAARSAASSSLEETRTVVAPSRPLSAG
jgi:peptidoglycan/LPS O-acetylase OafA/YrhL